MRNTFPAFLLVRVVAISLYLCGMALLLLPTGELFAIKPINWHEEFTKKSIQWQRSLKAPVDEQIANTDDPQERLNNELTKFIDQKTKNTLIDVAGAEWEGFFAELAATKSGAAADQAWLAAKGFFKTDLSPLYSVLGKFKDDRNFYYLRITGANNNREYMSISLLKSGEIMFKAPGHLAFPYRNTGFWLILAGIIIYLLQATQAAPPNSAQFGYEKTGVAPDLIAAIFAPIFIFIGTVVTGQIGLQPITSTWFVVSGIFWLFAALLATSWLFTAYYRTYHIACGEYSVTFNTLFGGSKFDIQKILEIQATQYVNPWWKKALLAMGRISARNEAMRNLYLDKPEPGCKVICNDDSEVTIGLTGLFGLSNLFANLERRGIQVDEALKNYAAVTDSACNDAPWLLGKSLAKLIALTAIAITVFGIIATSQDVDPEIKSNTLPTTPFSTLKK